MSSASASHPISSTYDQLDELCANVIRGLAMDGVQKADSGHPGMPMGMATVAHVLWTRFLRHNPADPEVVQPRPLRALRRPRLDAALQPAAPGRLRSAAGAAQAVPPARQHHARPSRIRGHAGRRDDHRPAGAGLRHGRRHGAGRGAPGRDLQPARLSRRGSLHLRHRRRRRPGGRDQPRGGLAGRPSQAGQADLLLRRQPHQHRRADLAFLQRQRAAAVRGVRLARPDRRRLRHAGHRRGHPRRAGRDRPAIADHLQVAHRLRQPEQAGHRRGARLAAGRGGDPADQDGAGPARRRAVLGAGRRVRALQPRSRPRAARPRRRGTISSPGSRPSTRRPPRASSRRSPASCPPAGTPTCRSGSRATRSPPARPRARCWTPSRRASPR